MNIIKLFLSGSIIGMANVMPGVSGGTLAVVLGIYDKFVNAITFNVKKLWSNRAFIFPLVLGMLAGIAFFSKVIALLFDLFPHQTNFFFLGIILGSVPMLYCYCLGRQWGKTEEQCKEIPDESGKGKPEQKVCKWIPRWSVIICIIIGAAALLAFASLDAATDRTVKISSELPPLTFGLCLKIFIAGLVGAVVMIIPGISGSFFMLIMGVYQIVIGAIAIMVSSLGDLPRLWNAVLHLLPNGIGVLLGLVGGAKLVAWILKRAPEQTYGVIFGLIIGSAINLYPGFAGLSVPAVLVSILCIAGGFATAFWFSKK